MPVFLSWMLVASALGFIKVVALARLLPPADFGNYGTVVGLALLSSTLVSLGLIEGTIKLYPRLWVSGDRSGIWRHALMASRQLAARFAILVVLLGSTAAFLDMGYGPEVYLVGGLLGFGNALLTLAASLVRATSSAPLLQRFSFNRAATALVLACGLGTSFGWTAAIIGDAAATIVTLLLSRRALSGHFPAADVPVPADQSGGMHLYLATIFSSSTLLADRAIVNIALGPLASGAYAVIALMVQVGQLSANIVAQRLGPAVIKAFHSGKLKGTGLRALLAPTAGLIGLAVLLVLTMLAMWKLNLPKEFLTAYGIGPTAILLGGALVALQLFSLLEFLLIARDQEASVLLAGGLAAACFFGLFAVAAILHLPMEAFLGGAVLARSAHLAILLFMTRRATRRVAPRHLAT